MNAMRGTRHASHGTFRKEIDRNRASRGIRRASRGMFCKEIDRKRASHGMYRNEIDANRATRGTHDATIDTHDATRGMADVKLDTRPPVHMPYLTSRRICSTTLHASRSISFARRSSDFCIWLRRAAGDAFTIGQTQSSAR